MSVKSKKVIAIIFFASFVCSCQMIEDSGYFGSIKEQKTATNRSKDQDTIMNSEATSAVNPINNEVNAKNIGN